jgi:hypothetical protein
LRFGLGSRPGLLCGAATHALYLIATRWVGHCDDPATSIVFSALVGSLIMSLALPFSFVRPRDGFDCAMLGSLGLIGAVGHYLVIRAFRPGGGHRAAELCRAGRHRGARLSDLRQFPGFMDLGRGGDHHRLRALHRPARAPPPQEHDMIGSKYVVTPAKAGVQGPATVR